MMIRKALSLLLAQFANLHPGMTVGQLLELACERAGVAGQVGTVADELLLEAIQKEIDQHTRARKGPAGSVLGTLSVSKASLLRDLEKLGSKLSTQRLGQLVLDLAGGDASALADVSDQQLTANLKRRLQETAN